MSVTELPTHPLFEDIDTVPAFGAPVHAVEAVIFISSIRRSLAQSLYAPPDSPLNLTLTTSSEPLL